MRATLLALLVLPALAHAEPRTLTVDEMVQLALASNPRLAASRLRGESAHALALSAGGRLLPSIHLSEEYQHYDSPFSVAFTIPGVNGMPATTFPPIKARDQETSAFVAAVDQPLLGLLRLSEDYRAQKRSAEAADAGVQSSRAAMREAVELEYLRLFEAAGMEEIAKASAAELAEQVTVTQAKVQAGALTTADLLRVKVAAANARQQGIVAHTQALTARANLLSAIGLSPDDASVTFAEPTTLLDAAPPDDRDGISLALKLRPELAQARLTAQAARHHQRARTYSLLPEIDAEGAYLRVDGQVFAATDSAFVGVKAQWAIWEWGAGWYARKAARLQADAAQFDVESEERRVSVEVTTRRAQLHAAASAVELARETIASAEEAYRVTDAQVRAGAATTTDLLDAQSALTQSRLNLQRARYEEAMARVSLGRAIGR